MIELKDLTIGYAQKNNTKVVASHINATLHSGRLTCLIGANGIGKSTLLRTLSAFQPPLSGEIFISQKPASTGLSDSPQSAVALSALTDKQLSRLIGVVLTEKPDIQNMTVFELVGLGRQSLHWFLGPSQRRRQGGSKGKPPLGRHRIPARPAHPDTLRR